MGNSNSRDQGPPPLTHQASLDDPRLHRTEQPGPSSRHQYRERELPDGRPDGPPAGDRLFDHGLRQNRQDMGFFGLVSGSDREQHHQEVRRETRGEKEARRAERDRRLRLKERTRSMQCEDVDGGFLVTMGVYTGIEDFSKPIVRQMMIERRLAPFWKGLEDLDLSMSDEQLTKAVRGEILSIQMNPSKYPPPPSPNSPSLQSPSVPSTDGNYLSVPGTVFRSRARSCESGQPPDGRSSSPITPYSGQPPTNSRRIPVRPRSKTQAVFSADAESQNAANLLAMETRLPPVGDLGGKSLDRILYENSCECSICFLSYPKWLNKTRCCDQPICSECFVQIKRPDPHVPEHHGDDEAGPAARPRSPQQASDLVSEPACCPFCKVPEFGISYEAPPFRRGLAYANSEVSRMAAAKAEELSAAMIQETAEVASSPTEQVETRRRMTSLSVADPSVISTDMIRPDWAQKLANARAQIQRRAAAATALHTAAYVIGNESRGPFGFGLGRRGILRRATQETEGSGSDLRGPLSAPPRGTFEAYLQSRMDSGTVPSEGRPSDSSGLSFLGGGPLGFRQPQQPRIVDLEDMMMMEAIRQSLIEDEERKKKEEKENRKKGRFRGNSDTDEGGLGGGRASASM